MQLKRKLPWVLTGKSLLAVGSIAMVALALVTYSATVTLNFSAFFVQGMGSTATWSMTTSSGSRYLPSFPNQNTGVGAPSTPSSTNISTFAFFTRTGQGNVRINLAANVPTADFNAFNIFVLTSTGGAWTNATLFATTGFTTKIIGGIDGTGTNGTAVTGYLQINTGTLTYYSIQVNYVLAPNPGASTTTTFDYTPNLT